MDAEFVDNIVQQVMAVLRRQGLGSGAATASRGTARGNSTAAPVAAQRRLKGAASAACRPPGKVFVTAEMFLSRLAAGASKGGAIELAHNEFLTPNAADVAATRHIAVHKTLQPLGAKGDDSVCVPAKTQSAEAPRIATSPSRAGTLGLVVDRPNEKVAGVIGSLGYDLPELTPFDQGDCWIGNVKSMCEAVSSGAVGGGVALLPYAADAMVMANKIRGIRAVQGTRGDSVAAALRHFAANVLIIEHAFATFHEMRAMIRLFAAESLAQPKASALMESLAELER